VSAISKQRRFKIRKRRFYRRNPYIEKIVLRDEFGNLLIKIEDKPIEKGMTEVWNFIGDVLQVDEVDRIFRKKKKHGL